MNSTLRQNILVGSALLISIALSIYGFFFLRGKLNSDRAIKVVFSDVQGIKPGEKVQMAGIEIGQVDAVRLTDDNRAELQLGIHQGYEIPQDSRFTIRSGVLGNSRRLVVVPGDSRAGSIATGQTVEGDSAQPLDETLEESKKTLAESRKLIQQGQELVATLNQFIGNPNRQRNLDQLLANSANLTEKLNRDLGRTLANTADATENLKIISAQLPDIKVQLDLLVNDLRAASAGGRRITASAEGLTRDARKLTQDIDATVNENRQTLRALLESADEAAGAVALLTTELKNTVANKDLQENLRTTTDNVEAASANLVEISARLNTTVGNLEKLSGDPTLTGDIKQTVTNLRETTTSIRNLAARIEALRLPGEPRRVPTGGTPPNTPPPFFSTTSLLEPGLVFDSSYDTTLERLRVDANYTLLTGRRGSFYRLGVYDTGEGNRLNLQIGQANRLPAGFAYRYGLVGGRLGVGLDFRTGPLDWRFDLFDPNYFSTNARAKAYLNRDASLTFGIDALGRENRATLGLQLRR